MAGDRVKDKRIVSKLQEAMSDFILGTGTRRSKLSLLYEGSSVTELFLKVLRSHGYEQTTVEAVSIRPGERVPAFHVEGTTAYFGWIFWEKFTDAKMRKLWGSVVRNTKGDWAVQISEGKPAPVYANEQMKTEMDIDHVSSS